MQVIKPQKLQKGDKVVLLSPSGKYRNNQIQELEKSLKKLSLDVVIDKQNYLDNGYFAGTDADKIDALHRCYADKSIKAIFCVRGGFGTSKLLKSLDYDLIKQNPKFLVGMSDITVLQNAIFAKTGVLTYSGPMAKNFIEDEYFALKQVKSILFNDESSIDISKVDILNEGSAEGVLLGGNLLSFNTLLGTKYLPDVEDIILFFEEVREYRYAIDRAFSHLENAGVIEKVKGVIIGENDYIENDSYSLSIEDILNQYFDRQIPICLNAKFGHLSHHLVLPIGHNVRLCLKKDSKELILS
tara:strand:+ start:103 stop:999 length:897 start_codon:yes stop_codon:yes gene_type:complete